MYHTQGQPIIERNIMIQNNFPFITKIHSAFQTETHLIYTLEYIGGGDLQYHLDKSLYLTPRQIKLYLAELVLTLEHLHKMGIIFRDLKPSNILLAKDGHLKLTDFGLSVSIIETGKTNTLCGTHDYLSPEMLNGTPYSYSVDWWALGVIAYRLICGSLPFTSQNLTKLYDKIIECEYRIPRRIDQDSRDLITGLLTKDPKDRLSIEKIKSLNYFKEIDWQKVYKKEYEMDFVPYVNDANCAYNFNKYEDDYQSSDSCSLSSSSSNSDLYNESDISFIKDFSFSSNAEDFDF